jgi:O-antigen/teichoic acid export membrane protein
MNGEASHAQIGDAPRQAAASAGRRLLTGMGWTLLGTVVARGAALVASFFVARSLGAVSFGQLGAVENSIGMLAVFANLGLSLTSTKFVAKYSDVDPARAGRVLGLCLTFSLSAALLLSAVVIASAPWVADVTLGSPQLSGPLRLATAILVLSSLNGALSGALVGLQAFRLIATLNLALGIATVPVLTFGAAQGGVLGAIGGLIVVQALNAALQAIAVFRAASSSGIAISFRGTWQERRVLAAFSLPALVNSAMRSPVHWLCMAMLVHQPGGFSEMGLLHAANAWFLLLMFLPGQLANVYYPMFETALARNDSDELRWLVWKSVQLNATACGGIALVLATSATSVATWYGVEYLESAAVLRISAITGLIIAIQQPLSAYLVAVANMWLVTACSVLWAFACVSSCYGLLNYGASGVAAGRLIGYIAYAAVVAGLAIPRLASSVKRARENTSSAHLRVQPTAA